MSDHTAAEEEEERGREGIEKRLRYKIAVRVWRSCCFFFISNKNKNKQ